MWPFIALTGIARAEDPTFSTAQAEQAEKPETHVTGELGGTCSTGNTNLYAVNGLVNASRKWDRNKLSLVAGVNLGAAIADADANGTIDDAERDAGFVRNAEKLYADARYDRFLSDNDSLYALGGALRDVFAGYALRSHEQLGYSRLLVKDDHSEFKVELGADWAQENYVPVDVVDPVTLEVTATTDPPTQQIVAAHLLLAASHDFNEAVGVADTLEAYENVIDPSDLRLLNAASLTAALSGKFSVKLSHNLAYDHVPVEGYRPLDQTTMVTLVASLL
jgi:putative salt-induced outer membrane protein YdiY